MPADGGTVTGVITPASVLAVPGTRHNRGQLRHTRDHTDDRRPLTGTSTPYSFQRAKSGVTSFNALQTAVRFDVVTAFRSRRFGFFAR